MNDLIVIIFCLILHRDSRLDAIHLQLNNGSGLALTFISSEDVQTT